MYQYPHTPCEDAIVKDYSFLRLTDVVDVAPLVNELQDMDVSWMGSQWKWHIQTRLCILRSGEDERYPGSGVVFGKGLDAPGLAKLPAIREFLYSAFPEVPPVAWLGLSPPGSRIFLHIDNTPHWDTHHRIHIPLVTNPDAKMAVNNRFQHFSEGTVWALNNSRPHGIINKGAQRIHLVLDLPPTEQVEHWLASGTKEEGHQDDDAFAELNKNPMDFVSDEQKRDEDLMCRLSQQ